jgi:2-dehydropantoate 2-reductase
LNPLSRLPPVWVMGAGAIGCFVGGRLVAAGLPVLFIGRPRIGQALREHGLRLTDLDAAEQRLTAAQIDWHEQLPGPEAAAPGLVLLCVKSQATAAAAAELAAVLPPGTALLSLQNGVRNPQLAREAAPALRVIAGMVPFNVAELGPGHFHRGSSGQLAAEGQAALAPYLDAFRAAGLPLVLHDNLAAVQWAKLLLNLNNPVNALSGLPLREQLLHPGWRRLTAALMAEGLELLSAAGIRPAQLTPLPPAWIPALMRLPTPLFRLLAARMLRIDPQARSSMADDLRLGREPELDALCGELLRLAERQGRQAPRIAAVTALLQTNRPGQPGWAQVQQAALNVAD